MHASVCVWYCIVESRPHCWDQRGSHLLFFTAPPRASITMKEVCVIILAWVEIGVCAHRFCGVSGLECGLGWKIVFPPLGWSLGINIVNRGLFQPQTHAYGCQIRGQVVKVYFHSPTDTGHKFLWEKVNLNVFTVLDWFKANWLESVSIYDEILVGCFSL
jgi:hypothetical protein